MPSKDEEVLPTDIALGPAGTLKIMIKTSNLGLKPKNQSIKCGVILIMVSSTACANWKFMYNERNQCISHVIKYTKYFQYIQYA